MSGHVVPDLNPMAKDIVRPFAKNLVEFTENVLNQMFVDVILDFLVINATKQDAQVSVSVSAVLSYQNFVCGKKF